MSSVSFLGFALCHTGNVRATAASILAHEMSELLELKYPGYIESDISVDFLAEEILLPLQCF